MWALIGLALALVVGLVAGLVAGLKLAEVRRRADMVRRLPPPDKRCQEDRDNADPWPCRRRAVEVVDGAAVCADHGHWRRAYR